MRVQWKAVSSPITFAEIVMFMINNGNRTEWNPIRSVFLRVINKSDICEAGVRFVYHEYDYRQNWTTRGTAIN